MVAVAAYDLKGAIKIMRAEYATRDIEDNGNFQGEKVTVVNKPSLFYVYGGG